MKKINSYPYSGQTVFLGVLLGELGQTVCVEKTFIGAWLLVTCSIYKPLSKGLTRFPVHSNHLITYFDSVATEFVTLFELGVINPLPTWVFAWVIDFRATLRHWATSTGLRAFSC